jgi:hypothetical protein
MEANGKGGRGKEEETRERKVAFPLLQFYETITERDPKIDNKGPQNGPVMFVT